MANVFSRRWSSTGSFDNYDFSRPSIKYDDVVDRQNFHPDSELTRIKQLSGQGSTGVPVYDGSELPSDLQVLIRSGKLDKAEVTQIFYQKLSELEKLSSDSAEADKLKSEVDSLKESVGEHLDAKTDSTGVPQDSSNN